MSTHPKPAVDGWQALLLGYALVLSLCFWIVTPGVKIIWILYANLVFLWSWPHLAGLWPSGAAALIPASWAARLAAIDGLKALLLGYALFLGVCLLVVVQGKKIWILYASLIIPWSWRHLPGLWRTVAVSRLYRSLLVYLGFLLASMFWSPRLALEPLLATTASAITIAHFLLLTAGLRVRYRAAFDRYLGLLGFLAAASALTVIAVWYSQHPFPESRMEGYGYLDNPIRGAAVFGIFALVAWDRILRSSSHAERLGYGLVVLAILAYAVLSWTRSVLLAIGAGLVIFTAQRLNRRALWSFGVLGAATLALAVLSPELTAKLMRPEPYRPYIWLDAAAEALRHPWFGQGYFSDPSGVTELADGSSYRYAHSHSFFIENLRMGGVVGLGLAVWLSAYSLYQAFSEGVAKGNLLPLALLVYGLLCIAPNGWQLLPGVRIKEVWMMFWFPLGLAVSVELLGVPSATSAPPTSPGSCAAPDSDPAS